MIFPDIEKNSFNFKSKNDIRTSDFGGYIQTQVKNTRAVKIFTFHFSSLTQDQADEINDFLVDTRGKSFTFVHPLTDEIHEVRLLEELPDFTWDEGFYSSSSIVLEEV